jgi:DNA-binding CsgD family transcriptional regulator
MSIPAPKLNSQLETHKRLKNSDKLLKVTHFQPSTPHSFLQSIIEGFVDGVLILTERGEWVHANDCARRICHQLADGTSKSNSLPQAIWSVCESLIESRELFPGQRMIIDAEIDTDNSGVFRIRVRWLELDENDQAYLLVTIEDRRQSTQNAAIAEVKKYGLTAREAEVWLLRRAHYSYKEIAATLYITQNTVKKHLKNIYAKQEANLFDADARQVS